jgi:hypothetical protein
VPYRIHFLFTSFDIQYVTVTSNVSDVNSRVLYSLKTFVRIHKQTMTVYKVLKNTIVDGSLVDTNGLSMLKQRLSELEN